MLNLRVQGGYCLMSASTSAPSGPCCSAASSFSSTNRFSSYWSMSTPRNRDHSVFFAMTTRERLEGRTEAGARTRAHSLSPGSLCLAPRFRSLTRAVPSVSRSRSRWSGAAPFTVNVTSLLITPASPHCAAA